MKIEPGKIERMKASEVPNPTVDDVVVLMSIGPAFNSPGTGGYNLWERVYSVNCPGRMPGGGVEFLGAHGGVVATHALKDVVSIIVLETGG